MVSSKDNTGEKVSLPDSTQGVVARLGIFQRSQEERTQNHERLLVARNTGGFALSPAQRLAMTT